MSAEGRGMPYCTCVGDVFVSSVYFIPISSQCQGGTDSWTWCSNIVFALWKYIGSFSWFPAAHTSNPMPSHCSQMDLWTNKQWKTDSKLRLTRRKKRTHQQILFFNLTDTWPLTSLKLTPFSGHTATEAYLLPFSHCMTSVPRGTYL